MRREGGHVPSLQQRVLPPWLKHARPAGPPREKQSHCVAGPVGPRYCSGKGLGPAGLTFQGFRVQRHSGLEGEQQAGLISKGLRLPKNWRKIQHQCRQFASSPEIKHLTHSTRHHNTISTMAHQHAQCLARPSTLCKGVGGETSSDITGQQSCVTALTLNDAG